MGYPGGVDQFPDKLNEKTDGTTYGVEETVTPTAGVYSGLLNHGNIVPDTIRVYSGPGMTGERITTITITIPLSTPWRREIKIFSQHSPVYITYETPGDTVEADDVNRLASSITATQTELERYKRDGLVDGGPFIP